MLSEEEAGPFAALAALKAKLGGERPLERDVVVQVGVERRRLRAATGAWSRRRR